MAGQVQIHGSGQVQILERNSPWQEFPQSSLKPICHHIIGLHKNRKIIHRFGTGNVSLICK